MATTLTPMQRYATGALLELTLRQTQIHQCAHLGDGGGSEPDDKERASSDAASDTDLWMPDSCGLLRPVFRPCTSSVAPELADLRIELCPIHMREGCFWMIYFVLMDPRLTKEDAEILSTLQPASVVVKASVIPKTITGFDKEPKDPKARNDVDKYLAGLKKRLASTSKLVIEEQDPRDKVSYDDHILDTPVDDVDYPTFKLGKPLISNNMYKNLPWEMQKLHDWYMMASKEETMTIGKEGKSSIVPRHTILDINWMHAHYTWHRNQDGNVVTADSVWFTNKYWHPMEDFVAHRR
ncbi:hypothetical protein PR202_gb04583 [Eleusine coracana subsp. coracana]|uniref:BSD domain-containing protein n=1 Tax=Eleusine coracana subsp. coracana TaxID=191504 RepID=A0AAV5E4G9_ELECO|nr:hypothetical protein PR202_gb04583 [Eleusine coracana subsp. coracana]